MNQPPYTLQVRCPQCKRIGANVLVLATTFLRSETGHPCVECTGCHAFFQLGDLCTSPGDFYLKVPMVNA